MDDFEYNTAEWEENSELSNISEEGINSDDAVQFDDSEAQRSVPGEDFNDEKEKSKGITNEIFEWLDVLTTAIVAVVLIFSFFFRVATIDGESMENTLFNGEKVIITNIANDLKQGDIVVISRNYSNSVENELESELPIIKRVIAVEGQTVDIDFELGKVYVDGVEIDDSYTKTPTNVKHDIDFPVTVDEGCIFVLGDNRNDSLDSRSSRIGNDGMIDTRYVLGHVVLRIFPFNKIGGV